MKGLTKSISKKAHGIKFFRAFWGDFERYRDQIEACVDDEFDYEIICWGRENKDKFNELGLEATLVHPDNYDWDIASDHTFIDHKSLNHKLKALEFAVERWGEVIFLDWDCKLIKPLDNHFYEAVQLGNSLQVPLYYYSDKAFEMFKELDNQEFFRKLEEGIKAYGMKVQDGYALPNTGFIYCREKAIAERLFNISIDNDLEAVPDEFAVAILAGNNLLKYLSLYEPEVVIGKQHDDDEWQAAQDKFDEFIKANKIKDNYFDHR